jgi:hypothetical protein
MRPDGMKKAIEALETGLRIHEATRKTGMSESQQTMLAGMKGSILIALEELEK